MNLEKEFEKLNEKLNFIETKINMIMEVTEHPTEFKYVENEGIGNNTTVSKTLLDIWKEKTRKKYNAKPTNTNI